MKNENGSKESDEMQKAHGGVMTTRRFFNLLTGALILWALLIPRYAVSQDSVQIDSAEITQVLGVQKDNHRNFASWERERNAL